jgi:DNA-binding LacI/PurR family transcriptional regulator
VARPRRPTSADVARKAGVSRTTVSFVLNRRTEARISPATRERVLDAARLIGYRHEAPPRRPTSSHSRMIGLVLRQSAEQVSSDALLAEVVRGVSEAARDAGHHVLLEPLPPTEGSTYGALVRTGHTDGLIVSGPRWDDAELLELVEDGYPIVVQGTVPDIPVPSVDVDNRAGARHAVGHLVKLGHRSIACITNAPLAYTAAAERLAGYRDALEAAGVTADDALVAEGEFDASSGHRAMNELLARGLPFTAVFVASDVVALGALASLREHGYSIPDDISVVGFDDIPLAAHFDPPLTTIRVPAHDLGFTAGRALLERLGRRSVTARTLLPTELIVRASTAPLGGAV